MQWCLRLSLLGLGLIAAARPLDAQILGRAVSAEPEILLHFDQPDTDYDVSGDMFGVRSRDFPDPPDCFECPGIPDAILDRTFDLFSPSATDKLGLIKSEDFAPFFGVVDTVNMIRDDLNAAVWTFDVAGHPSLRISAEMAAMGDFEAGNIERPSQDVFVFEYALDGGPYEMLFESSVDTQASQGYEMELPHPDFPLVTLDDPLTINGVTLHNTFQTLSATIPGGASRLEVRFRAMADGGEEAFAFRNLLVEAVDDGGSSDTELAGDYNASGKVEQADLDLVLLNWGSFVAPLDWNYGLPNGPVDQEELDAVLLNWGQSSGPGPDAATVAEPVALGLALACVLPAWIATHWPFRGRRRLLLSGPI